MRRERRDGPNSPRQRPHDGDGPSRDTAPSKERESGGEARRRQPDEDPEMANSATTGGAAMGLKQPRSTVLTPEEEAVHRGLPAVHPVAAG